MVERTDTKLFSFQMNLPPFLHLSLNKEIAFDVKGEILIARVNNDKNHDISCKLHVFFYFSNIEGNSGFSPPPTYIIYPSIVVGKFTQPIASQ